MWTRIDRINIECNLKRVNEDRQKKYRMQSQACDIFLRPDLCTVILGEIAGSVKQKCPVYMQVAEYYSNHVDVFTNICFRKHDIIVYCPPCLSLLVCKQTRVFAGSLPCHSWWCRTNTRVFICDWSWVYNCLYIKNIWMVNCMQSPYNSTHMIINYFLP